MRVLLSILFICVLTPALQAATPRTSVDSNVVHVLERYGRVDLLVTFRGPPAIRERSRQSQRLGDIREQEFSEVWESFESHMGKAMDGLEVTGASMVSMKIAMTVYDTDTFDRLRRFPRLQSIEAGSPVVRTTVEQEADIDPDSR